MDDQKKRTELVLAISNLVSLLSTDEKTAILSKVSGSEQDFQIPLSIFKTRKISGLEAISVYLKENHKVNEISKVLNRKPTTIYPSFKSAKNKLDGEMVRVDSLSLLIPISTFSDRKYSVLESVVAYLKEQQNYSLSKIAELLNRSYSTVKTVYQRYKLKC